MKEFFIECFVTSSSTEEIVQALIKLEDELKKLQKENKKLKNKIKKGVKK